MAGLSELGQVLHEEHFRILVAICGLENRISGVAADRPLDATESDDRTLLQGLMLSLEQLIAHHAFEEKTVFPLIRSGGEGDLASLLHQEHGSIEPKATQLRQLAEMLVGRCADAAQWSAFRRAGTDLIAELMQHLEKEELTVVQRLPAFLDAQTDHQLAVEHRKEEERARTALSAAAAGTAQQRVRHQPCRPATASTATAARAAARRRCTAPAHRGV